MDPKQGASPLSPSRARGRGALFCVPGTPRNTATIRHMTRLSQIIAVEKGVKADATRRLTDLHRDVQKQQLLSGLSRTYRPRAEDGHPLPPESTKVQLTADDVLREAAAVMTRLFDVTLTKDAANTVATADVMVDGRAVLVNVPVTYLLFLEKQLTDLHTFLAKIPVLDPSEEWQFDDARGCYASAPASTVRTAKVPRNHVRAEATDKHPAQVDVFTEDVPQGDWTTVKFSGALPVTRQRQLLERLAKLQHAVKFAREEANATEITDVTAGEKVFGYLLGA